MDAIEYAKKMSEGAYEQEKLRADFINKKSESLLMWLTLLVSIFNVVIPILAAVRKINYHAVGFISLYIILLGLFISAIIILITLNFPQKVKLYMRGEEILKQIQKNKEKYLDREMNLYYSILSTDAITKSLSQNNDKAIQRVKAANIMLVLALIVVAIFCVYIIWRI